MLDFIDVTSILFFDIETVPATPQYSDLDERIQDLWHIKAGQILKKSKEEVTDEDAISVYERAGIYAEFGKIVCISVGIFRRDKARVWQHVREDDYTRNSGLNAELTVLPLMLLQTSATDDGLVREWTSPAHPALHHIGYALMWFIFSIMAGVYGWMLWKR